MLRRLMVLGAAVGCLPAVASEGKWTPQQVQQLGAGWVKQQGFSVPLNTLWDPVKNQGLLANAVQLPGCSGSFISADGLLITNHHCAISILQEHSTPQANLVKDGFLAKTREDERASKSFRLQVPRAFRDVTAQVLAGLAAAPDDRARFKAVEAMQKALVAECEKPAQTRCTFATFDGGVSFTLTEFTELADVRLVYAPPTSVGDFGGEVDNWTWPRHTGDFSLLRAYVDGKPYHPAVFFPISTSGVKPGDAVAVLGYPGQSFRSALADEIAERETRWYPKVVELTQAWEAIIEDEAKRVPETAVAVADDLRGVLNTRKNAQGQIAGLARGHLVDKQRAMEERVKRFAQAHAEYASSLEAYAALSTSVTERLATWDHDFLLDWSARGARALTWPLTVVRRSVEGQKPDAEREPGWQERDLARLRERLERDQKRYAPAVDQRLFATWVRQALVLPKEQRLAAIDAVFKNPLEVEQTIAQLARSKIFDPATRKLMLEETPEQLKARHDPLVDLALALDAERRELRDRRDMLSGRALLLRPRWRKAVAAEAKRPLAPDANSTLRVTFGTVKGYAPRDAVEYQPQTTLAGLLQKHTGSEPFDVPARVRAAAEKKGQRWRDRRLDDVPVDFLSDCDTTGGNSGSPTIDAQGRLVGVNFDRVWENVANDFGYNPAIARNVNVDARYLLWLLDEVEGAGWLLKELGATK